MGFLLRIILVGGVFWANGAAFCFAQTTAAREEKMEESIRQLTRDVMRMKKQKPAAKTKTFVAFGATASYETNAELGQTRKGDLSEEYFLSTGLNHMLNDNLNFKFNYDLDVLEYNEITDLTSYLNHANAGLHWAVSKAVTVGAGVDVSYLAYPNSEDGNFIFYKDYAYIKHNISPAMYHQLLFEQGVKYYTNAEAMDESFNSLQEKKRQDGRVSIEYSFGDALTPKLFVTMRGRFSVNDSNARFQDYYDYKTYEFASRLYYELSDRWSLNAGGSYIFWPYTDREITVGGKRQKDNIYSGGAGLRYKFNKNNSLSVNYSYRQGLSNDSFSTYSGSTMSCGWMAFF